MIVTTQSVTTKTVVVELTEAEAQHVEEALFHYHTREMNHGGVWIPFCNALISAKIKLLNNK